MQVSDRVLAYHLCVPGSTPSHTHKLSERKQDSLLEMLTKTKENLGYTQVGSCVGAMALTP